MKLSIFNQCFGGFLMGILGIFLMVWQPFIFYSDGAFVLLIGLFFVREKLLNAGVYGFIIVSAIAIINRSFAPLILLVVPAVCFLLVFFIKKRSSH